MLKIRLQRKGRSHDPKFRLVLTDSRKPPKSGEMEILGSYGAKKGEAQFKAERIKFWLLKGAKISPTVKSLLTKNKII
jgi:small subunit ribosomal protein S16